jgi:hypothetical protein
MTLCSLVTTCQATRCHNPQGHKMNGHRRGHFISQAEKDRAARVNFGWQGFVFLKCKRLWRWYINTIIEFLGNFQKLNNCIFIFASTSAPALGSTQPYVIGTEGYSSILKWHKRESDLSQKFWMCRALLYLSPEWSSCAMRMHMDCFRSPYDYVFFTDRQYSGIYLLYYYM